MNFTISDLKKQLGPGLGLRKAKYLIEIPFPNGAKINVLCRSTSLPERNIGTVDVFKLGRRYRVRAETNYPGTYNISIMDDSSMLLRRLFDGWADLVDRSPYGGGGGGGISAYNKYQADINIWQLTSTCEKIYGYTLQNAFPASVGTVELSDEDESSLSEFSVDFAYSEHTPISGGGFGGIAMQTPNILGALGSSIMDGIGSLF